MTTQIRKRDPNWLSPGWDISRVDTALFRGIGGRAVHGGVRQIVLEARMSLKPHERMAERTFLSHHKFPSTLTMWLGFRNLIIQTDL